MRSAIALLSLTTLAAFGDQNTIRPGDPTTPRVWVENRGRPEAIPIDLQTISLDAPVRVQSAGDVSVVAHAPLPVKAARAAWEYRTIAIAPGQDVPRVLDPAGAEGWEATGTSWTGTNGTLILMKRQR